MEKNYITNAVNVNNIKRKTHEQPKHVFCSLKLSLVERAKQVQRYSKFLFIKPKTVWLNEASRQLDTRLCIVKNISSSFFKKPLQITKSYYPLIPRLVSLKRYVLSAIPCTRTGVLQTTVVMLYLFFTRPVFRNTTNKTVQRVRPFIQVLVEFII